MATKSRSRVSRFTSATFICCRRSWRIEHLSMIICTQVSLIILSFHCYHPHLTTCHLSPSLLTPMSVVSALSTFQDKFSISTSSCACWYSNCDGDMCGGTREGGRHQIYQMLTRSACTAYQWLSISLHEVSIRVGILQCISALYIVCVRRWEITFVQ